MFTLMAENWWLLLIAFLIGIATAWWVWAHNSADADAADEAYLDEEPETRIFEPPPERPEPQPPRPEVKPHEPAASSILMDANKSETTAKQPVKSKTAPSKPAATKDVVAKPKAPTNKPAVTKVTPKKVAPKQPAEKDVKPAAKKAVVKPVVKTPAAKKPAAPKVAVAKPAAAKASPAKAAKPRIPDDLELLKGVGPKLNNLLASLGVTSFDQVANWSAADIRDVDSNLGAFAGRITRDNWVDQAKLLSKGDVTAFEKKYGSLGGSIKR